MLRHEAVREAAVLARGDEAGQPRLVGYVVAYSKAQAPTIESLRAHLGRTLPDYMVPSAYVLLDTLPLTPNGKLDREALPEAEGMRRQLSAPYVGPRNPLEATLAGVLRDVLQIERVGIHDNFFDLGGNSLLLAVARFRINAVVNKEVPLIDLLRYPTIAKLAEHLGRDPLDKETSAVDDPATVEASEARTRILRLYDRSRQANQSADYYQETVK